MDLKKYRVRANTFRAAQVTEENAAEVARWCKGLLVEEIDAVDPSKKYPAINVKTRDGEMMRAGVGDWVVETQILPPQFLVETNHEFVLLCEEAE